MLVMVMTSLSTQWSKTYGPPSPHNHRQCLGDIVRCKRCFMAPIREERVSYSSLSRPPPALYHHQEHHHHHRSQIQNHHSPFTVISTETILSDAMEIPLEWIGQYLFQIPHYQDGRPPLIIIHMCSMHADCRLQIVDLGEIGEILTCVGKSCQDQMRPIIGNIQWDHVRSWQIR